MDTNQTCDSTLLLIRGFDIFQHITDAEYEELALKHNFIEAAKGEYIYFPQEHHNKLFFTKSGYIKLGYINENGEEVITEVIQRGEVFGQLTVEQNNQRDEFAQAYKNDVSLCAFNINDFMELLKKKPAMAISFSTLLNKKLKKVENRIASLLNKDVKCRLINLLLQLGVENNNRINIERFLTHEDIARLIGAARQTVTTLLNEMENEKLLQVNRHEIIIPDIKKIKQLLMSHA